MKAAVITTGIVATAIVLGGWRAPEPVAPQALLPAPSAAPAPTSSAAPAASSAGPMTTPVAAAARAEDPNSIRISGRVQPRTTVAITAMASLPVVALPFKEGDRVTKGDPHAGKPASVLIRQDQTDLQAALNAAKAKCDAEGREIWVAERRLDVQASQIAAAKLALDDAQRQWGRLQQLIASGDTSAVAADEAKCKAAQAKTSYQAVLDELEASQGHLAAMYDTHKGTEAEVERARIALAQATILSPIDGVITRINVHVGEVAVSAASNPGNALIEVADLDHPVLVARADEQALGRIAVGQKAMVHLNGFGKEPFVGTVQRIALAGTEGKDGKAHFRTDIALDTRGKLIPAGVSGEARIECPEPGVLQ